MLAHQPAHIGRCGAFLLQVGQLQVERIELGADLVDQPDRRRGQLGALGLQPQFHLPDHPAQRGLGQRLLVGHGKARIVEQQCARHHHPGARQHHPANPDPADHHAGHHHPDHQSGNANRCAAQAGDKIGAAQLGRVIANRRAASPAGALIGQAAAGGRHDRLTVVGFAGHGA